MFAPHDHLRLVGRAESPSTDAGLPWVLTLDDADTTRDVIDAMGLAAFVHGEQPFARSIRLEHVRPDAPLRPAGARVLRAVDDCGTRAMLAVGEGWTLRTVRWSGGSALLEVTAVTDELAHGTLDECAAHATEPPKADETQVTMGFWHMGQHGPQRRERAISAGGWAEIAGNYTARVGAAISRLMAIRPDDVRGRLVLLHGPPGTGKTTALRALAREWASWCQVDCVLDPELLFGSPGYLMEVAVGVEPPDGGAGRWRLLVLEDCDELIRGEAKASTGQGLSRLLNLTDGILGQGRDVLVAITTNEDLSQLHPAVVRPGRCLAQIEVGRLSVAESLAWLDRELDARPAPLPAFHPDGATLAELTALRGVALHTDPAPIQSAPSYEPATAGYL